MEDSINLNKVTMHLIALLVKMVGCGGSCVEAVYALLIHFP